MIAVPRRHLNGEERHMTPKTLGIGARAHRPRNDAEGRLGDRGCGEAQEDRQRCEGNGEDAEGAAEEGLHTSCTFVEARLSPGRPWQGGNGGRPRPSTSSTPLNPGFA